MTKEIVEAVRVLEREKGISAERADGGPRGRAPLRLQEDSRRREVRARRHGPGHRRLQACSSCSSRPSSRSSCSTRWRRRSRPGRPRDGRAARARGAGDRPGAARLSTSDQIDERDVTPDDFGRIAAQTAKQVILQRIREAERDMMFDEYQDRVGELITGIVQQSDSRYTLVQLRERVEALLPQVRAGRRRALRPRRSASRPIITDVSNQSKGPSIIVSRRSPELIRTLFELEVPEIADGLVEIQNVAREPGYRSKIAVVSHAARRRPGGRLRRPARLARAHGRVRAARREDRHHPLQRGARPLRGQGALARARARGARGRRGQAGDGDRARTTSCRWRSARRARTPASPPASPAGAWTSARRRSSPRKRRRWATTRRRWPAAAPRSSSNGKRCPNASLPRLALLRPARASGARRPRRATTWLAPADGDRGPRGRRACGRGGRRGGRGRGGRRRAGAGERIRGRCWSERATPRRRRVAEAEETGEAEEAERP